MKRNLCLIAACMLAIISINAQQSSSGYLRVSGKQIVNENGQNVILRGIGFGGWMLQEGYMLKFTKDGQQYKIRERIEGVVGVDKAQEFYDLWLSNHTTRADIDSLKRWGFNSVRLPMHYNLYTLPVEKEPEAGKQTWLKKGFDMTDSLLAWCKANEMYLILDLHAAPGGQGNDLNISDRNPSLPSLWQSKANQEKTVALWKELAVRYVNEPWIGAYDIINEPNWGFADTLNDRNGLKEEGNGPLKELMVNITKAIRSVDTNHIIIIEGNGWGNNYKNILPTWDKNMVLSFHKYWNNNDQQSIQHIIDTRDKYNVPVWLGETGENSNTWFTEAIRLLETNNIGWAWWPLKKMGINNPLEIPVSPGYQQLLDYWSGKSKVKPSPENAWLTLKAVANSTNIASNIVHHDVIDAMIRQPFSTSTRGMLHNHNSKGIDIAATDYDLGQNGFAYFDNDTANYRISTGKESTGNAGHQYRNDGVDIYRESAPSSNAGNYYVGKTEAGEWLQYTVSVSADADYILSIEARSKTEAIVSVTDQGKPVASDIVIASGDKWNKTVLNRKVHLVKGTHSLRLLIVKGGVDLKSVMLTIL